MSNFQRSKTKLYPQKVLGFRPSRMWRFPKIRGTFLGCKITGNIVPWVYVGSPYPEKLPCFVKYWIVALCPTRASALLTQKA